ncbi:conserved hypothetical protein [Paraburkholderia tropica]|uniref:glycoside hydrolase family 104 protein n=1 Tax=Paraburkholderia tropica TaxID=92647 RepID=UPI001CB47BB6|nr:glycoside hydrolase family 104 protein [Paraburkholderia tropica]CAG9191414.1 conserved hypothetical protein [Paraburkholderia tropica]
MSTQSPTQPQATPAATQPQPVRPQLKWRYPFAPNNDKATGSPQPYLDALGKAEDGFYPLGANGIWHGGIHFDRKTAGMLKQDAGVSAIADGEIIAYRLDSKYPELDYADGHKALYSTSFVLVRHKLVMPATPKPASSTSTSPASSASSTSPSASTESAPAADEVLEFYSLYMHLLDWDHYDSAQKEAATHKGTPAVQHMQYWKGDQKFIVGSKAHDKQTEPAGQQATSADPIGDLISNNYKPPAVIPAITGLHIRELPDSRCKILGILPQGSEITVAGTANKGWARISKVLKGAPVGKTAGEDAPAAAATGWVFLGELDSETIPSPLDAVVVLDPPFPVKAGDRIGYPGHYLRYSDTSQLPPQASRPLLHLEVFAGDPLKAFIEKSAARAKNAPDSEKTMLVVSPGAKLVPLPKPAQAVAQGLKLKPVEGAPTSGLWTKVQPMRMPTSSAHGHGHGSTHQAQGAPEGSPLWVERNLGGQVVPAGGITGWSDFPLKIANAQGPAVAFQDVFTPGELQQLPSAQDDQKHKWWEITVGTGKGESTTGWICSKNHPEVAWRSPWEWPGFEIVDNTSVSIVDAFKRSLYVKRELFDSEEDEFKPAALDVSGSPLITKLEKAIDHDDNGTITAAELAQAQGTPWLAEALSHLIVRYESEWGGSMGKWDELSSLMKEHKGIWQTELERITKLQWWDKVSAVKGFPASPVVYHLHPIGLIGNFASNGLTLEEARVRAFLRTIRVGEGTIGEAGYERLFGGESFIKNYGRTFSDHPRILITRTNSKNKTYSSTAAGAYQVMGYTWDDPTYVAYRQQYGIMDFTPASQDKFCVILLKFKRHALEDIKKGDIQRAIINDSCNKEWASLPGDVYGQGGVDMKIVSESFAQYLDEEMNGKTDLAVPVGGLDALIK